MSLTPPKPLPPPAQVPLFDPQTGRMAQVWAEYFASLDQAVRLLCGQVS
jgi:hypothetical protein